MNETIRIDFFPKTDPLFAHARAIRTAVFLEEQNCPEDEEWDDADAIAQHCLCRLDGEPAGTLRCYDDEGWLRIGRLAVTRAARGKGLAGVMLSETISRGRAAGFSRSFLNAQSDKMGLYRKFGYAAVGGEFVEAGIPHYRMEVVL